MKFHWNRKLVLIKTFNNEISARITQSFLKDSGIEAVVLMDNEGVMTPELHLTSGVRLWVDAEHAERAAQLLSKFES